MNERERRNRQLLQDMFEEDMSPFVSGYEYDYEQVVHLKKADMIALKQTLDRIMLYQDAGWFGV